MIVEDITQNENETSHISIENSVNQEAHLSPAEVVPWLSQSTSEIKNPNIRFHNEIIDFFDFIRPWQEDHEKRRLAIKRVLGVLTTHYPEAKVVPYGSFLTELYLSNSDINLVFLKEDSEAQALVKDVKQILKGKADQFMDVRQIQNSRFPELRFREIEGGFEFCLAFNCPQVIQCTEIMFQSNDQYPELKYLLMILKVFLMQRNLQDNTKGGVDSFLLFNMILAFLRDFKQHQIKKNSV